jgi:6-phosphogluconolactonase (cycloisomerase 2 family)
MNRNSQKKLNPNRLKSLLDDSWANLAFGIFPPYISAVDNTGTYMYISDGSDTITRIRINDQNVTHNWTTSTQGINYTVSMATDNTHLYVLNNNNTISQILLSDPATYNATWATSTQGLVGSSAMVIDPSGTYMYIANPQNGTISQILISNPDTYVARWAMIQGLFLYQTVMAIEPTGTYLYVTNNVNIRNNITQIQLSDPSIYNNNWVTIPQTSQPSAMVIDNTGTYMYLLNSNGGSDSNGSITQIQMNNTSVINTTWLNSGLNNPRTMSFTPAYIYVVNNDSSTITQVQLQDPVSNPPTINNWLTLSIYTKMPYLSSMVIDNRGTYMYVTDYNNNTITQLLMSNPSTYNATWATSTQGLDGSSAMVIDGTGTYLYVANYNNSTISRILLSNPSTYNATWATSTQGINYPIAMVIDGTYLYVANSDNSTISRILLSNPSTYNATWATSTQGLSYPSAMVTDGTYLYVANCDNSTISQILLTDPATYNSNWATSTQGLIEPSALVIDGTYLYVTNYYGGTDEYGSISQILLSDPTTYNATWATSTQGLSFPRAMDTDGTYLYVINDDYMLTIIRIPLPSTPQGPIIRQYGYNVKGFRIYNTYNPNTLNALNELVLY